MPSTLTTLMQRALYELDVGFVVPNADISAIGASSFTAARFFHNTNMSSDFLQLKQAGLVRAGAATAADLWRPAGTLVNTTGVVSQVGPNWADTTVGAEEIEAWYYGVRRDQEVLKSLNRVTEFRYTTTMLAVSHLSRLDGDMALSTDTNWTDVGATSISAKVAGEAFVPYGPRGYQTVNNAVANSGTRSASVRIETSGRFSGFTIATSTVGTPSLQGWDATNGAVIGTATTTSEFKAQLLCIRSQEVPATCKAVALNMTNEHASGNTIWNQAWLYNHTNPMCPLPASLSESFMAPRIYQARPQYNTGTNTYDAEDMDFRPLMEGVDYWFIINHNDAQPYKVRFRDTSYYDWPLFVEARIPMSSQVTFSAESDAVNGPLHEIMPAFKKDLLETVYNIGARRLPDWQQQYNLAQEQLTKALAVRPKKSVSNPLPYYAPRNTGSIY